MRLLPVLAIATTILIAQGCVTSPEETSQTESDKGENAAATSEQQNAEGGQAKGSTPHITGLSPAYTIQHSPSSTPSPEVPTLPPLSSLPANSSNTTAGPDLIQAAANGDPNLVTGLIDVGNDPNKQDSSGVTPLIAAAMNGHKDTVLVLLSQGADPQLKDKNGKTAAMHAKEKGHTEIAEMIATWKGGKQNTLREFLRHKRKG